MIEEMQWLFCNDSLFLSVSICYMLNVYVHWYVWPEEEKKDKKRKINSDLTDNQYKGLLE